MRLPWSVTNGASPGPGLSVMAPWHPVSAEMASISPMVAIRPNRTTSTGSGNRPSDADQLAVVDYHHHPVGCSRDDLLPQERPAATLDHAELAVDLVGAVDREIELRRLVERSERDIEPLGLGARGLRGRHADHVQAARNPFAERGDEVSRGRAGAEPEPHPVGDEIERGAGGAVLQLVDPGQRPSPEISL